MPVDVIVLAATAVVAVVALGAAVVTVRSARQSARDRAAVAELLERAEAERDLTPVPFDPPQAGGAPTPRSSSHLRERNLPTSTDLVLDPRPSTELTQTQVVDGKVIVVPTQQQLIATALSRPTVRFSVFVTGVAHALRPESRDRVMALMRREFARRRKERRRAARQAARTVPIAPARSTSWVSAARGEEPR
ncbi:MAG: hypothetical protein QM621_06430 [Aeromicrobium sp.]|uniref:hypothetical protein n=1 Tax=Aeromicrobium sp. TaxID=1871063 RepID=UPI0039E714C4